MENTSSGLLLPEVNAENILVMISALILEIKASSPQRQTKNVLLGQVLHGYHGSALEPGKMMKTYA